MEEFTSERHLPDCCRRSYQGPNGSYHRTGDSTAEFCCLECGTDWAVEFGLPWESFDEAPEKEEE